MNVGSLVAVVAAVHYFYMREYWVVLHPSPILYRYGDWSITVPLQMIEFYVIEFAMGQGVFKSNPPYPGGLQGGSSLIARLSRSRFCQAARLRVSPPGQGRVSI